MIQDLLKAIHSFYPVGINNIMAKYEGLAAFRTILSNKINSVMEGESTSWSNLVYELGKIFSDRPIMDQSYNQFPSYLLSITFFEKDDGEIKLERRLLVNVSLLCSYYTIFFETRINVKSNNGGLLPGFAPGVFSLYSTNDPAQNRIDAIKMLVEAHFKGYQFAYHKTLFDYCIEGCGTYSNWQEYEAGQKYPVYSYLFDSHLLLQNILIAD